jgi:hypothetical protein
MCCRNWKIWIIELQLREGLEISRKICGAEGNRTPGLLVANEARYQLRYSPA